MTFFSEPEHEPRLRHEARALRAGEHRETARVARRRAHDALQASDCLDVVVEHVGAHGEQRTERLVVTFGIGDERLDLRTGIRAANFVDASRDVRESAVVQVVARDHREHDVRQTHALHRLCDSHRLVGVGGQRFARVDETKPARARAALAQHHECRGAVAPALRQVRAARFFAHRDETQIAQRLFRREHLRAVLHVRAQPLRFPLRDVHSRHVGFVVPGHVVTVARAPALRGESRHHVGNLTHRRLAALLAQRSHRPLRDAARNDVLAHVTQVGVDIQRKAVHRAPLRRAAGHSHTDCADFSRARRIGFEPDPRILRLAARDDAEFGK